jgi:ubiquinone biosynthesis protein UbiJ
MQPLNGLEAEMTDQTDTHKEHQANMNAGTENPPGLVKTALADLLQTLINQAVAMDSIQGEAFLPCAEKVVQTSFTDVGLSVFWVFHPHADHRMDENPAGEFVVQTHLIGEADAHLHANLFDWLQHGPAAETVQGDVALGETFLHGLKSIDIDWEEQLSKLTGDLIAHQTGEAVRGAREQARSLQEKAWTTLREYLQFELKLLPQRHEIARFEREVADTEARVDALTHRIEKLMSQQMQPHLTP